MYWIIFIGFAALAWGVQRRLKNKFRKYSAVGLQSGMSGAEVAAAMLAEHRINNVQITCVPGELTDHYNPANRTVNLSEEVFYGRNVASAAVAAHECGHAVQHAEAYSMLSFRTMMVPVQNLSSRLLNILFMVGMVGVFFVNLPYAIVLIGLIACYAVFTVFSLVTLPVEFDASRRAVAWISDNRIVNREEGRMAEDALHWAAMTYVVAALSSITMLLYYVAQFLGSRD